MEEGDAIGRWAEDAVRLFLEGLESTQSVVSVRRKTSYQNRGIDLLWNRKGATRAVNIEVKGDTYTTSPNFFLEEISNTTKGTAGCFVSTQSDVFAYCFVNLGTLFLIPTREAQQWHAANGARYERGFTNTFGDRGQVLYQTAGRKVPRSVLRDAIPSIQEHDVSAELARCRALP